MGYSLQSLKVSSQVRLNFIGHALTYEPLRREQSADLMAEGKTYPQEGPVTFEAFETYFFKSASTTVVGITHNSSALPPTLEAARSGNSWEDCVGGCYYMFVLALALYSCSVRLTCSENQIIRDEVVM
jgi:hypothetical protein